MAESLREAVAVVDSKPHAPAILMTIVCLWLIAGAAWTGHTKAFPALLLFFGCAAVTYFLLCQQNALAEAVSRAADIFSIPSSLRHGALWIAGAIAIAIALLHFILFDGFTVVAALAADDQIAIALMRQNVTASLPSFMKYATSIAAHGLFPVVIVLAIAKGQRMLALLTGAVGLIYAVCLMQKSGPILLMLPLAVYLLSTRHLIKAAITIAGVGVVVIFMGFAANPQIRPTAMVTLSKELQKTGFGKPAAHVVSPSSPRVSTTDDASNANLLAASLLYRVLVTPGEVVGQWFDVIPAQISFGEGCGYRFLSSLLHCNFQNYPRILYDHLFPAEVSMGLQGTVNAASMMTAYANFGWLGLALIGVFHAIVAWVLLIIFQRDPVLTLPINMTFILLLSSGDIFTLLFSGGWGLSILLFAMIARASGPQKEVGTGIPAPTGLRTVTL
jgi:hypothetical protein